MPLTPTAFVAESFEAELSAAIDDLQAFGADGNIDRVSDESDPSHESTVDLRLKFSGYAPRRDLAEALCRALLAVWGPDCSPLLLEEVIRENR